MRPRPKAAARKGDARAAQRAGPAAPRPSEETTRTLDIPGLGLRTYHFPSRFQGVELLTGELLVPAGAAASWLPEGLEPVRFLGRASVRITFQYLGLPPDGMKPYTEASLSVKARTADGTEGWHTLEMPVDSLENQQRGEKLLALPKTMGKLSLRRQGLQMRGEARSEGGRALFSLGVRPLSPVTLPRRIDNLNLQERGGELVDVNTVGGGSLRPGWPVFSFGEAMRSRYPGLPRRATGIVGGHLTDGHLAVSLPEKHLPLSSQE